MVFAVLQSIVTRPEKLEGQVWESLPTDIVTCIVRCSERSQLPCLRLVNKHWRLCCDSIISEVSISRNALTHFGTPSLALDKVTRRFPKLKSLVLWKLNSRDVWMLPRLMELRLLDLGGTNIDDESLSHISPLKKLRTLQLWETQIGDKGLVHISKLNKLSTLSLQDTKVTDEGMRCLAHLRNLTSLDLDRTKVGDTGIQFLLLSSSSSLESEKSLPHLKKLSLWRTFVGDQSMKLISQLTNLVKLNIGFTRVTIEGLEGISTLTKLTSLEVWGIKTQSPSSIYGVQQQQEEEGDDQD
eukprot:g4274.t1